MASVADILEKSAELIEPEGAWTQGYYETVRDGVTCYCAVGAIFEVAYLGQTPVAHALVFTRRILGQNIVQWNDAEGRTQSEVVEILRTAGKLAREQGK